MCHLRPCRPGPRPGADETEANDKSMAGRVGRRRRMASNGPPVFSPAVGVPRVLRHHARTEVWASDTVPVPIRAQFQSRSTSMFPSWPGSWSQSRSRSDLCLISGVTARTTGADIRRTRCTLRLREKIVTRSPTTPIAA